MVSTRSCAVNGFLRKVETPAAASIQDEPDISSQLNAINVGHFEIGQQQQESS
jgi:hypothetical protein